MEVFLSFSLSPSLCLSIALTRRPFSEGFKKPIFLTYQKSDPALQKWLLLNNAGWVCCKSPLLLSRHHWRWKCQRWWRPHSGFAPDSPRLQRWSRKGYQCFPWSLKRGFDPECMAILDVPQASAISELMNLFPFLKKCSPTIHPSVCTKESNLFE